MVSNPKMDAAPVTCIHQLVIHGSGTFSNPIPICIILSEVYLIQTRACTSLVCRCWPWHGSEINLGTVQPGCDVMRTMAVPNPFGSDTRINPAP